MRRVRAVAALAGIPLLTLPLWALPAAAQQLDLTHGGPIDITARDGLEWRQNEKEVIARGDARAIRANVTVTADTLIAWYRKKGGAEPAEPAPSTGLTGDSSTAGSEIYRLQAEGHVHIFTATDQAWGDKATYDLDQAVMVLTGHDLKLTTPNDVITARDDLEYWPQKHMSVARGDAIVVTNDAKRVAADTLVAYTTDNPPPADSKTPPVGTAAATPVAAPKPAAANSSAAATSNGDPLASSGKLQRVEAFGHVSIRTPTDIVTGDRGVYVPDTGMARLAGGVHITRGQNQLNGAEADVNMKTGIATLVAQKVAGSAGRVHGLVVPNDDSNKSLSNDPAAASVAGTPAPASAAGNPAPGSAAAKPAPAATPKSAPTAGSQP